MSSDSHAHTSGTRTAQPRRPFEVPAMTLRYGSGAESSRDNREAMLSGRVGGGAALPSAEEIFGKYPVLASALSVWAAGSVVQGWGHGASDLDLYVVTDEGLTVGGEMESFERRVSTDDPVIHIVLGEFGAFRADIELWRQSQIDELVQRFSGGTRDQEAPDLDKTEQDLFYRLVSGRPLSGTEWWQQRRTAILQSKYGTWLAENRKLAAEGYLEDVGGMLQTGDQHSAVLAGREAFVCALEALLVSYDDYSINRKWLYRRLVAAQPTELTVDEGWRHLATVGAAEQPGEWAESAARLAQRLLLTVEEKYQ